ncbi:MAG: gas vesicle protein GvpO [Actinoallomurus sp.]
MTVDSRRPERDRAGSRRTDRSRERRALVGEEIARLAVGHVEKMTGHEPEGVVLLERRDDGGWTVGVEVVETRRIPDSTDILAVYEAQLDEEGELVAYRRVKRYSRCQVGD